MMCSASARCCLCEAANRRMSGQPHMWQYRPPAAPCVPAHRPLPASWCSLSTVFSIVRDVGHLMDAINTSTAVHRLGKVVRRRREAEPGGCCRYVHRLLAVDGPAQPVICRWCLLVAPCCSPSIVQHNALHICKLSLCRADQIDCEEPALPPADEARGGAGNQQQAPRAGQHDVGPGR